MKRRYFGTDGVRGVFGGAVVNPDFAARLGEAAARWAPAGRVLIGRDTRASGPALLAALATGFRAAGRPVEDLGVLPTPAVAREVRTIGAALGVVITASHNPASDNGIKFFGPGGIKLSDAEEQAMEDRLPEKAATGPGTVTRHDGAIAAYVEALSQQLQPARLAGWRVVVDAANGATCHTTPRVLERLGATVVRIGAEPNGENINAAVGSEHPAQLAAAVLAAGAHLGVAHDGDGDRCVLCDERGQVLDGDEILTLLAVEALRQGRLAGQTLIVTQQSNLGVDAAIKAAGGRVLRTDIGDRYVAACMRTEGASLGGESSGHIICDDVGPTGDGLGAALKVISVMLASGKPLSELRQALRKYPQQTGAIKVARKPVIEACPTLSRVMAEIEKEMGEDGRLLVRYSGTEPKLRLLVEGPTEATVADAYARLAAAAQADLNAE